MGLRISRKKDRLESVWNLPRAGDSQESAYRTRKRQGESHILSLRIQHSWEVFGLEFPSGDGF